MQKHIGSINEAFEDRAKQIPENWKECSHDICDEWERVTFLNNEGDRPLKVIVTYQAKRTRKYRVTIKRTTRGPQPHSYKQESCRLRNIDQTILYAYAVMDEYSLGHRMR